MHRARGVFKLQKRTARVILNADMGDKSIVRLYLVAAKRLNKSLTV